LLALGSVTTNTLAKALRWKILVGRKGGEIPLIQYLMVLLAGQMLNALFPARLGDLARAYSLGGMGAGRTYALGTVVLEKMMDALAYVLLFGMLVILMPLPEWVGGSILVFVVVMLTIAGGILLLVFRPAPFIRILHFFMGYLPAGIRNWLSPRIESGLSSLKIIRRREEVLRLVSWTVIVWGTAILNNHLVMLALDIHLPLTASLLVLVGLQAGISLPAIPGTIGLFEYICILALSLFNVGPSTALSFGLLLHAIVFIPPTLGGLISFWVLGLSGQRPKYQDGIA
jgi:uncharacterized protein (TIRG00374 family)